MRLIYINISLSSVFSSQVVALLNHYILNNAVSEVKLLCGFRNEQEKTKILNLITDSGIKVIFFKTFPNYPIFNLLQKNSISKALKKTRVTPDTKFHIRGEMAAYLAMNPIKHQGGSLCNTLVDVRGAALEEILEFNKLPYLLKFFKLLNIKKALASLSHFKKISCVTESLKNHLLVNSKIDEKKIKVIPCLANKSFFYSSEMRNKTRKEMNIKEDDFLMIFSSGGEAEWQNFELVSKLAINGYKILNLSRRMVQHPNVINKFVPYNMVSQYISAGDAAIIYRNKSIVNKVSCPVKYTEYISAGLPIISNKNIDTIAEYIETFKFGELVSNIEEIDEGVLIKLKKMNHEEISQLGISLYGIENISKLYLCNY